jgi:hypothetical protein
MGEARKVEAELALEDLPEQKKSTVKEKPKEPTKAKAAFAKVEAGTDSSTRGRGGVRGNHFRGRGRGGTGRGRGRPLGEEKTQPAEIVEHKDDEGELKKTSAQIRAGVICWGCGGKGHYRPECPSEISLNPKGTDEKTSAPPSRET